jgi:hypothetical protein
MCSGARVRKVVNTKTARVEPFKRVQCAAVNASRKAVNTPKKGSLLNHSNESNVLQNNVIQKEQTEQQNHQNIATQKRAEQKSIDHNHPTSASQMH